MRHPEVRIDIQTPQGEEPRLVGLFVQGFGWIVGGHRNGDLTIRCDLTNARVNYRCWDSKSMRLKIARWMRRWANFDWRKNDGRTWPTGPKDDG